MSGAAQGYIGRNPGDSQVTIARQQFTPTGVTTDFTFTSGYTAGYVDVYINGSKILVGRDYTATNGSVVGLTSAAQNGDIVEIVAYKAFNVNNVSESAGNFTVGGILTVDDNTSLSGQLEVTGVTTFVSNVENIVTSGVITATTFSGNITGTSVTFTNGTFTGDVSIGGTLTYEDVTNIDSVGIVTARAGVNVSGGQLQVGVAYSVGNAGVCTAAGFVGPLTGAASRLTLTDQGGDSSCNVLFAQSATGNQLPHTNANLTFNATNGTLSAGGLDITSQLLVGSGITMGSAGVATFSGTADIHLHDGVRLKAGDSSDLSIYHDGSHSYIDDSGTGSLYLKTSQFMAIGSNGETMIQATEDTGVYLRYNNGVKFETTNDGAKVTGSLATGGTAGALLSHAGTTAIYESQTAGDSLTFKVTPSGGSSTQALAITSVGDVEFSGTAAGVKSCFWDASANTLIFNDNSEARWGNSGDLRVWHDGSNTHIVNNTGYLNIQAKDGENSVFCQADGEVNLYHNNSIRFATTSTGAKVHGGADNSYLILTDTSGNYCYQLVGYDASSAGTGGRLILADADGGTVLDARAAGGNIYVKNSLRLNVDNLEVSVGVDNDLKAYHNGTDSYIDNATGNLAIRTTGATHITLKTNNENAIYCGANGAVQVYYDASEKFKTTNDGTVTTGISTATSFTDSKGDLRSIPRNNQGSAYTLVAADAGKCVTAGGNITVNDSVFAAGDAVSIIADTGSDITITQGSGVTMYNTADASTGSKTLAARGMCTIWFVAANNCYISGAGLS